MFQEPRFLERLLAFGRLVIPRPIFEFFQPWYHGILALSGQILFGWPSNKLKLIGVTGTKGKSTTVYLITKFLEEPGSRTSGYGSAVQAGGSGSFTTGEAGHKVAAISSLGYKIGDKEWPNNLKITMPGRWKIQKFLKQALKAGCQFAVLEVTSEGIKQKRHLGLSFDAAVFTNLEKEHIESHGSFEKYYREKQKLFKKTKNLHVLNVDSKYVDLFSGFPAKKKIFYGLKKSDSLLKAIALNNESLLGEFNKYNILAAAETVKNYGVSPETIQKALDKIKTIPGRMEFIETGRDFKVVIDYAHTPGSLEAVYKTLKKENSKLICVLGAAGGGRDKWKRPIFGHLAETYCDKIILTDEDPYDENPLSILKEIESGFSKSQIPTAIPPSLRKRAEEAEPSRDNSKSQIILDRREAIKKAVALAEKNDIIVITGKGSENSMAIKGGKKIPWSDKAIILELLNDHSI